LALTPKLLALTRRRVVGADRLVVTGEGGNQRGCGLWRLQASASFVVVAQ